MVIWEYNILSHIRVEDFSGKLGSLISTLHILARIKTNKIPKVSLIVANGSLKCTVLLDSLSQILPLFVIVKCVLARAQEQLVLFICFCQLMDLCLLNKCICLELNS